MGGAFGNELPHGSDRNGAVPPLFSPEYSLLTARNSLFCSSGKNSDFVFHRR